jgi:hypothetical protein
MHLSALQLVSIRTGRPGHVPTKDFPDDGAICKFIYSRDRVGDLEAIDPVDQPGRDVFFGGHGRRWGLLSLSSHSPRIHLLILQGVQIGGITTDGLYGHSVSRVSNVRRVSVRFKFPVGGVVWIADRFAPWGMTCTGKGGEYNTVRNGVDIQKYSCNA